jgi:hypothetical protein
VNNRQSSIVNRKSARFACLIHILLAVSAFAQTDLPDTTRVPIEPGSEVAVTPFIFSGSSRIYSQLANRRGTYQETPDDFARLELSPTFSLYNVPFTINMLLSTEQSAYRQNINSISLDLDQNKLQGALMQRAFEKLGDVEELQALSETMGGVDRLRDSLEGIGSERLRDLDRLKDYADLATIREEAFSQSLSKLNELGLVAAEEKFFANFPALSIGVTYPRYTELTLNAAPVTGANIEWNPGKFYIAAAGGKSQRSIRIPGLNPLTDSILFNTAYSRSLYSARIGFGKKDASHIIFTGLYAKDDAASLPMDSLGSPLTPQANYVLGVDVNIPVVENYFTILGEIAGSVLTGDINAAELADNDVPDFVRDLVAPNISSLIDYAFSIKSVLRIPESDTRFTASLRQVGPVFFSLGVPALRNDNIRWDARLEQRFLRRQITATAYYRRENDDIYRLLKSTNTTISAFGVGLGLNFSRLPYLRVEYAPYQQSYSNLADQPDIENTTTLLSAIAGYYYKLLDLNAGTNVSFSSQQSSSFQGLSDYGVATITANQSVNFRFPLALSVGFTHSSLTAGDSTDRIISLDLSGSYTAFDIWNNSVGFTLSEHGDDANTGFFVNSSVALWDAGVFELRAEKNVFKSLQVTANNFDEFVLTATLTSTW